MVPIIEHQGGAVLKTMGDSIMAIFDEAEDAVRAANAMQRALDRTREADPDIVAGAALDTIAIAIAYPRGVAAAVGLVLLPWGVGLLSRATRAFTLRVLRGGASFVLGVVLMLALLLVWPSRPSSSSGSRSRERMPPC